MEITLHAPNMGPLLLIVLIVPVLIMVPVLISRGEYPVVSLPCSALIFLVGCGAAIFTIANTYGDREDLPTAAKAKYGITDLEPVRGANEFTFCQANLDSASEEYTWTDEDGEPVEGTIERSAEDDLECTFTIKPNS